MQVKWTVQARQDLRQAINYIHQENPKAALTVLERIYDSAQHLERHPNMGRIGRVFETRELIVPATLFIIVYRVTPKQIEILSVIHGHQSWPESFE